MQTWVLCLVANNIHVLPFVLKTSLKPRKFTTTCIIPPEVNLLCRQSHVFDTLQATVAVSCVHLHSKIQKQLVSDNNGVNIILVFLLVKIKKKCKIIHYITIYLYLFQSFYVFTFWCFLFEQIQIRIHTISFFKHLIW